MMCLLETGTTSKETYKFPLCILLGSANKMAWIRTVIVGIEKK